MTTTTLARPGIEAPAIRGFGFADMERHGRWMLPRLNKLYPHLSQREIETWLRGIVVSGEYLMLCRDNSVALAQVSRSAATANRPLVTELFVWCENPEDKDQQKEAAEFYANFQTWAGHLGADTMVVEESSDVPHDQIKEKLGRLFERKQWFARL